MEEYCVDVLAFLERWSRVVAPCRWFEGEIDISTHLNLRRSLVCGELGQELQQRNIDVSLEVTGHKGS